MMSYHFLIFALIIATQFSGGLCTNTRRILHQPLFPVTLSPPPPPPPPPPPAEDQPFFPEVPSSGGGESPPLPAANETTVPNPTATQPNKATHKVAIVISVGIVTLGMLSALAFYLFKHRAKHTNESQKLVTVGNSQRFDEQSRIQPSSILYIGTVEPPAVAAPPPPESDVNIGSPYRKLSSVKRSWDRYRPSPELQPLPPLTKPPLPVSNSPPPMSESSEEEDDEESHDTNFYTPNCSSSTSLVSQSRAKAISISVPHSKRTSPKSRLSSSSSSDSKPSSVHSIKQHLPPPPPPPPPIRYSQYPIQHSPKKPKFSSPLPPIPPPPQKIRQEPEDGSKPKLKPLHWDKVRATSDRAMVWDHLRSSSFQLNEDMMETLFGSNSVNPVPKETTTKKTVVQQPVEQENRVLDPKKSQNIAIMLRALNVTRDEVSEALVNGNQEGLGAELLETLVKMAPTKEEEIKLKNYSGDVSKLGSAERFLKAVLDIPYAFKRVEAMLYRANFDIELKYLRKSFQTLEEASEELKKSRLFLKLLEAVLRTGNRMNVGTNRGDAKAFKLDTLLKLVDIKGTDGKTTLLHFVVQEIIRSEGATEEIDTKVKIEDFKKQGLPVVAGLSRELGSVKKAAGMDSDVLSSYLTKLEMGLEKVRVVMQYEKPNTRGENFFKSMKMFLEEAEREILRIKADERKALSLVKEVTEYFHGDAAKEEAHPLRIFMIVRDFLSILDHVCKDVGRMQDTIVGGSARAFRIATTASLPVLQRYNVRHDRSSDDESSSS